MHALTLLGQDHVQYGRLHHQRCGPAAAAAISVGARPDVRSALAKADPNEDALCVIDDGVTCLLAVADAHFGQGASHALIEAIAAARPRTGAALIHCLKSALSGDEESRSETTLTVALFDRASGQGSGLAFGDSSAVCVDDTGARRLVHGDHHYLRLGLPEGLRHARLFEFTLPPAGLLVLFTDGVDECHYRQPATSIGMAHLADLFASTGPRADQFARRLGAKALNGVDDNPGGEDNIAIAVSGR